MMNPLWLFVAGAGLAVIIILGLSWRAVAAALKALLSGKRLHLGWKPATGPATGRCPKCGRSVEYSDPAVGKSAFTCGSCGESGKWTGTSP